ncbi:MAG: hypothetical protein EOP05_03425 [Proteobacteria bacterium]|nr:MAG: hypothetical protein EOP05_03425 [Pseudomonadota bacterium]
MKRLFGLALSAVMMSTLIFMSSAQAVTRPMFIAGTAIILMEGFSSSGGADPQPKELYDAIAMEPVQTSGGYGKVLKTASKDFSLTCGTQGNGVVCNITVKKSDRSSVDGGSQTAEIVIEGSEAQEFYTKLAGAGATQAFVHDTRDQWIHIESTPERFYFRFKSR